MKCIVERVDRIVETDVDRNQHQIDLLSLLPKPDQVRNEANQSPLYLTKSPNSMLGMM
jgi:hypothetical protein